MKIFRRLKYYLQRIYRLTLSPAGMKEKVWDDLKKLHKEADWRSGVYENGKFIETVFGISEEKGAVFYHFIQDDFIILRVKVLEDFPEELTTEFFILATHFNNLLKRGKVMVDPGDRQVEYFYSRELLIPLLYKDEIYADIKGHVDLSKDIHAAFKRLLLERESPAIIIADLLRQMEKDDKAS